MLELPAIVETTVMGKQHNVVYQEIGHSKAQRNLKQQGEMKMKGQR